MAVGVLLVGCGRPEPTVTPAVIQAAPVKPAPAMAQGPYTFGLEEIKSLKMTRGPEEWTEELPIRLQGATWTFRKDGKCVFAPTMAREALYPIPGTYRVSRSQFQFEGARETSDDPAGHARAEVWGTVEFAGTAPVVTMRVRETHGTGTVDKDDPGTHINQTEYEAVITLKRK